MKQSALSSTKRSWEIDPKHIKSQLEFHEMISWANNNTTHTISFMLLLVFYTRKRVENEIQKLDFHLCLFLVHWSPFVLLFILSSDHYVG